MIRALILATTMTSALNAAAMAAEDFPTGWYLETFDNSGITDIALYWHDVTLGHQSFTITCTEGYADVVITAYAPKPETDPTTVTVTDGTLRHDMDAISGEVGGLWSSGGITTFTPDLMGILSGQFTVLLDDTEQGRYSAKGAADKFQQLFEGCPAGE